MRPQSSLLRCAEERKLSFFKCRRKLAKSAVAFAIIIGLSFAAFPGPLAAGENIWTRLGPVPTDPNHAWSMAIAVDPTNSTTVYHQLANLTSVPSQIQKSVNATGGTGAFTAIRTGCDPVYYSGAVLTIDPQAPQIVYAICQYSLVRSTDGGSNWQTLLVYDPGQLGLLDSNRAISDFAIDPADSRVLYAAGVEHGSGVIFKSLDGGEHWEISILGGRSISKIAIAPNDHRILYAADWNGVMYKSSNIGATWSILPGISPYRWTFSALGVGPHDPNLVIGCTGDLYSSADFCVRSRDGGTVWEKLKLPLSDGAGIYSIVFDPLLPGVIYAGGDDGVSRSLDWGASWTLMSDGLPKNSSINEILVLSLAVDNQNPRRLMAGTADGVFEIAIPSSGAPSTAFPK